jgi:membrane-bound lytic murein transglycosylase D
LRLRRFLLLLPIAALAACATTPSPPPPDPLTPIIAEPLQRLALVPLSTTPLSRDPFGGAGVELEPLPLPAGNLWERIVRGYRVPDVQGPLVDKWQDWYAQRPDYVARMVERSRRYLYHIVNEIEMRGMPVDLALLPMVESAFNPHALSGARAAGIWQFMPATGTTFGLKQNWWFDSRRDVLAATNSALDYLQKLEAEFGDWQLALAAYNWGEGNVRKAIARNQARGLPTDFASLTGVPDETRNYIPKLQAVKNLIADPGAWNLSLGDLPDAPYFAVVKTTREMDVKRAAELAELTQDEFLSLNPQHNRPVIAGADEYALLLPIDNAEIFAAKLQLIDQPLVSWQAYRTRPGDTLASIATKFNLSLDTLRTINGIGPRAQVPTGHTLLVPSQTPVNGGGEALNQAVFTTVPAGRTFYYTVRRGETLGAIAHRLGVSTADLKRWNHLSQERNLRAGQQLRVTSDAAPVRSVRRAGKPGHASRHRPGARNAPAPRTAAEQPANGAARKRAQRAAAGRAAHGMATSGKATPRKAAGHEATNGKATRIKDRSGGRRHGRGDAVAGGSDPAGG